MLPRGSVAAFVLSTGLLVGLSVVVVAVARAEVDRADLLKAVGDEPERAVVVDVQGGGTFPVLQVNLVVPIILLQHQARLPADPVERFPERPALEVKAERLVGLVGMELDLVAGLPGDLVEDGAEGLVGHLQRHAPGGQDRPDAVSEP